jgi:hypothetical protein
MKKQIILFSILLVSLFALFSGCTKREIELTVIEKTLPHFREVEINNVFDVYLTEDSTFSIRIEADAYFADKVTYVVEDSILKLDINSKRMWLKPREKKIKLFVHAHHLRLVHMNQSSLLKTTNAITSPEFGIIMQGKLQEADLELNCPTFFCWNVHPCGGQLQLRGTTQNLKIWSVALLAVKAENLTTSYALIEQDSKADCRVHVTNHLEYGIGGEGNILLSGRPAIISQIELSATGRLIEVD